MDRISGATLALLVLAAAPALGRPSAAPATAGVDCALGTDEAAWVQGVLDGWSRLTREILHIPTEPLPWVVTFDDSCAWHLVAPAGLPEGSRAVDAPLELGGSQVPVRAVLHDGTVMLPSGREVPARATAFASLWDEGHRPFFVLAMESLWQRDAPGIQGDSLHAFFLGVAAHEMLHTRQLVAMGRRVAAVGERCELPADVHDTTIEELFEGEPEFGASRGRDRDLLFDAAAEADAAVRRELARGALEHLRRRRARFFTGERTCFGEIEDLFLGLEGAAVWAHYRLAAADPGVDFLPGHPGLTDRDAVLEVLRDKRGEWVQDAGFGLFLLLDEYVAGWAEPVLGEDLASPVALLEAALEATGPAGADEGAGPALAEEPPAPPSSRPPGG